MSQRKDTPKSFGDIEKPHETVADAFSDGPGGDPLTVRLGELWNELARAAEARRDPEVPRARSALPLLDEMKGIVQWD